MPAPPTATADSKKQLPSSQPSSESSQQSLATTDKPLQVTIYDPPKTFMELGHTREQWQAMTQHLYPNALSLTTISLVAKVCKAKGLDPMTKPYHIVPMWSAKKQQNVDSIWPSVDLYKIQASRSGTFAGKDKAVFGPLKTFTFKNSVKEIQVEMPEWCTVTIYKFVNGEKCAFESDEIYYSEYVGLAKGKDKEKYGLPNDMWLSKGRSQMAKCALSAALRLAWPELCSEHTAEEMEGRTIEAQTEPSAKEVMELAEERAAEKREVVEGVEPPVSMEEETGEDTIDAEIKEATPTEVTLEQQLEAARDIHADAGNELTARAAQDQLDSMKKITQKEVMSLNSLCKKHSVDIKTAIDYAVSIKPDMNRNIWPKEMDVDTYALVVQFVEAVNAPQA